MDTPQVEPALLTEAAGPLRRGTVDAVLGPAADGGWWALGLRDPRAAAAIAEVPTSRDDTGERTAHALRAAGLRVGLLPELTDVDTAADAAVVARLAPGRGSRRPSPGCRPCPATRRHRSGAPGAEPRRAARLRPQSRRVPPVDLVRAFDPALAGASARLVRDDGVELDLAVRRWRRSADGQDRWLLDRCTGPVIDLGCGPGRLVSALGERGVPALGVDLSAVAQRLCRRRRTPMVRRDVFGPLPGEGTWGQVLLADGNIGIGGDPLRLLHRAAQLLRPGGSVLVETDTAPDLLWRGTVAAPHRGRHRRAAAVGVRGCGRAGPPRGDARAAPERPATGGPAASSSSRRPGRASAPGAAAAG